MQTSTPARHLKTRNWEPLWLFIAFCFWLANVALHLEFSNWLVVPYNTPFGEFMPIDFSTPAAAIFIFILTVFLWRRIGKGKARLSHGLAWILCFSIAAAAYFLIMTTPIEAIHYA